MAGGDIESGNPRGSYRLRGTLRFVTQHYELILLALAVAIFVATRFVRIKAVPIQFDEAVFIDWAQKGFRGSFVASVGYGKAPLYPMALALFDRLFTDPLVAARVLSALSGGLALIGITLIGKELRDLRLGAWAALFWVLCPYMLWYERLALVESMLVSLMIMSVLFAVVAVLRVNYLYLIGTGLFLGLALWTKQNALVMFAVIPLTFAARGPAQMGKARRYELLRWLSSVAMCLLLGYGLYNVMRVSESFARLSDRIYYHTHATIAGGMLSKVPDNLVHFMKIFWRNMTPFLLILGLGGLIAGLLTRWRPAIFLTLWFLALMLVAAAVARTGTGARYWVIMMPPLALGAGYAMSALPQKVLDRLGRMRGPAGTRRLVTVGMCLVLCVLLAVAISPAAVADARSLLAPEKAYRDLTRISWGWGYDEVVADLGAASERGPVSVFTGDTFTWNVLRAYLGRDPQFSILQNLNPIDRASAACAAGRQVFYVRCSKSMEGAMFRDITKYPRDNSFIVRERERSTLTRYNRILTMARLEVPYIASIVPGWVEAGGTVTLHGGNFGTRPEDGTVWFRRTPAGLCSSWSDSSITVVVPEVHGWALVKVETRGGISEGCAFKVI